MEGNPSKLWIIGIIDTSNSMKFLLFKNNINFINFFYLVLGGHGSKLLLNNKK